MAAVAMVRPFYGWREGAGGGFKDVAATDASLDGSETVKRTRSRTTSRVSDFSNRLCGTAGDRACSCGSCLLLFSCLAGGGG